MTDEKKDSRLRESFQIGVDLGTTNIVIELLGADETDGKWKVLTDLVVGNSQRVYGTDVLSRIQAANEGMGKDLKKSIRKDLKLGMEQLLSEQKIGWAQLDRMVIAGNTTMEHLFMGYSCESLGTYPFVSDNLKSITTDFFGLETIILPGISAFVGADLVAGMYCCGFQEESKPSFLIDLGTNGEICLGNQEKILVGSVAAGPAFESMTEGEKTIERVYDLWESGLIDETGMIVENGNAFAMISQEEIRDIQLAKSAVRAGVETLLLRYGIDYDEVGDVFLAGGIGYHVDPKKIVGLGMLPKEFQDKIKVVGNSSLEGVKKYLREEQAEESLEAIIKVSREIPLGLDGQFRKLYMEYMMFDKDKQ